MAKHSPHIGGVHSNYKFGKPSPRTSRQAFGTDFDEHCRSADAYVLAIVALCSVVGLVLVSL